MRTGSSSRQRGFTYIGLLLAVALIGVGLLAASEVWVTTARHQRLRQLDWTGEQFVQAIGSYYDSSPGSRKTYPASLEELLEDRRFLTMRRHLRQVYVNPFTGSRTWNTIADPAGGVAGVRVEVAGIDGTDELIKEYRFMPMANER